MTIETRPNYVFETRERSAREEFFMAREAEARAARPTRAKPATRFTERDRRDREMLARHAANAPTLPPEWN